MAKRSHAGCKVPPEIRISLVPSDDTVPYRFSQLQSVIRRMVRRSLAGGPYDIGQTAAQESKEVIIARSKIDPRDQLRPIHVPSDDTHYATREKLTAMV